MTSPDEIISVKNVFKIFGAEPETAMRMLAAGASKKKSLRKQARSLVFSTPASRSSVAKSL